MRVWLVWEVYDDGTEEQKRLLVGVFKTEELAQQYVAKAIKVYHNNYSPQKYFLTGFVDYEIEEVEVIG